MKHYRLFREYANRYDLHTPPGHYQDDHKLVISHALSATPRGCRLLDVGCGTGVFLESAIDSGIDGHGIDASPEMVDVARKRIGSARVRVQRMQELSDERAFDVVCSLSWAIHYCETAVELERVLANCRRALSNRGLLLLQVANSARMTGGVAIEREAGPSGEPGDTLFVHRFRPLLDAEDRVLAEYVYASQSLNDLLVEQHILRFASVLTMATAVATAGFRDVVVLNSESVSPFIVAKVMKTRS